MAAITPSGNEPIMTPKEGFAVSGLDGKMHHLAQFLSAPQEASEKKDFVAVKGENRPEIYLKFDELSSVTGITREEVEGKSPQEVAEWIARQNRVVFTVREMLESRKDAYPELSAHTQAVITFTAVHLRGREDYKGARSNLLKALKSIEHVRAFLHAVKSGQGVAIVPKEKGRSTSLIAHEGKLHFGGATLGKGGSTKVSAIDSTISPAEVKAVARGKKIAGLERHLAMVEQLNQLGIPNITTMHRVKFVTQTKSGEAKTIALLDRMDGDARSVVDLLVPSLHIGNILLQCAKALEGMHRYQYVHSDVKPANILLKGNPQSIPKLDSEGILHAMIGRLHDFGGTDRSGKNMGTFTQLYAAPEIHQAELKKESTLLQSAQDAFAFGVTIFEMASTRRALEHGEPFGKAQTDEEIHERNNDVKRELFGLGLKPEDLLLRIRLMEVAEQLMRMDPQDRISSEKTSELLEQAISRHLDDINDGRIEAELKLVRADLDI